MSTRQDFVTSIGYWVFGNKFPIGEPEKIKAVDKAVKEHSKHKPKIRVVDVTGTATFEYKCTTYLTYWKEGFSTIKTIEYPVDDTDETPDMILDEEMISNYRKSDGEYFRFLEDEPSATQTFRVNYTAPHVVDNSGSTIDYNDEEAVEMLAASYFCLMLAAAYSSTNDSTISADSVNHRSKAQEFRAQAKEYREKYFAHLGIKEGENVPSCEKVDWDNYPSWQSDRLTHLNKYR